MVNVQITALLMSYGGGIFNPCPATATIYWFTTAQDLWARNYANMKIVWTGNIPIAGASVVLNPVTLDDLQWGRGYVIVTNTAGAIPDVTEFYPKADMNLTIWLMPPVTDVTPSPKPKPTPRPQPIMPPNPNVPTPNVPASTPPPASPMVGQAYRFTRFHGFLFRQHQTMLNVAWKLRDLLLSQKWQAQLHPLV
jgi:hypothetical protein